MSNEAPPRAASHRFASASGGLIGSLRCNQSQRERLIWGFLALASGLLFALRASWRALTEWYVVHDDARQHIFWIPRLHDPELFPNDPIADYFAAQAPPGFVALYFLGTLLLDAVTFNKLLVLVLTVSLSGFAYLLGLRLFRHAAAAGLSSVLLAWSVWHYDYLASATPRSFTAPLLVVFLAFLVARQRLASLTTLALQALVYPPGCALMLTVQLLWLVHGWLYSYRRHSLSFVPSSPSAPTRRGRASSLWRGDSGVLWLAAAAALALGLTLLGQRSAAIYGPIVSAEEAREMAEFRPGGRANYFSDDPLHFWLTSTRSGLALAPRDATAFGIPAMLIPLTLAGALAAWMLAAKLRLTGQPAIPRRSVLLLHLLAASLALFFAAHVLLFRLYLPSRHVQFSLPIVWSFSAGLMLTLTLEHLAGRLARGRLSRASDRPPPAAGRRLALAALGLLLASAPQPGGYYIQGRHLELYDYLRARPKDTLVAALPRDSSRLPIFTQRSVLVSLEHSLPYHRSYYEPLRRRTRALLQAYYADSPELIVELAEREGVDVIVANTDALERRRGRDDFPLGLETLAEQCAAVRDRELVAIPVECVRRVANAPPAAALPPNLEHL